MATLNTESTPHKATLPGLQRYRQDIPKAAVAHDELGEEMVGSWYGPYGPSMFMDHLMPISPTILKKMDSDVQFPLPVRQEGKKLEKHLYQYFEETVQNHNLTPGCSFFIAANGKQKVGDPQSRPDGGISENKGDKASNGRRRPFNWYSDGLVVEFKKSSKMDPFYSQADIEATAASRKEPDLDRKIAFEKDEPPQALATRGQLARYASLVFAHQHRTHIFQLLVCGRHVRFIFWDHSGAIVSDSFDYVEDSALLAQFFWRYSHMSNAQRGFDSSVSVTSSREKRQFRRAMEKFLKDMIDPKNPHRRRLPQAEDTLDERYPILKVSVEDDVSGQSSEILIQAPFFVSQSALGRATRGYIAYHIASQELVFFKDTWRVKHPRLTAERTVCQKLIKDGVRYVPQIISGGDVTANDERDSTRCLKWVQLQTLDVGYEYPRDFHHHRLLQPLAYPVESAPNSKEFVIAFRDCLRAIKLAKKLSGYQHRDISIGNIMIRVINGKISGILADWDHAGKIKGKKGEAHQNFRTGTWQFMSIALLKNPRKLHDILDDFEAVFWTLLYGSIHHYRHTDKGLPLRAFDQYEMVTLEDGTSVRVGGGEKLLLLGSLHTVITFSSKPLNFLIRKMAKLWSRYYFLCSIVDEESDHSGNSSSNSKSAGGAGGPPLQDASDEGEDDDDDDDDDDGDDEDDEDEDDEDDDSNSDDDDDPRKALKKLNRHRKKLSKPSTWLQLFKEALEKDGWERDDGSIDDLHPPETVKEAVQNLQRKLKTSHMTGTSIRERENNVGQAPLLHPVQRKTDVPGPQSGGHPDDDKLRESLSDWDLDDAEESCICEEDAAAIKNSLDTESKAFTAPPSAPLAPKTDVPFARPPRFSCTIYPDRSAGSSRLKRTIDEVTPPTNSSATGDNTEEPAPKKTRSRSTVKAEPTDRKTRSSSRKAATRPPVAATASKPVKEKETRSRRALKTGDFSAAPPRREGLRPRKAKSATR